MYYKSTEVSTYNEELKCKQNLHNEKKKELTAVEREFLEADRSLRQLQDQLCRIDKEIQQTKHRADSQKSLRLAAVSDLFLLNNSICELECQAKETQACIDETMKNT